MRHLGEDALSRRASLRGCQLRAIITGRRSEGPAFVQALRASGEYDRLVQEDPDAATTAVFGLHLSMVWASLLALLPADEASPGARAMRYVLQVGAGRVPPRPWRPQELDRLSPNIGLFQCGLYFQGRFADVEHMAGIVAGGEEGDRPRCSSGRSRRSGSADGWAKPGPRSTPRRPEDGSPASPTSGAT